MVDIVREEGIDSLANLEARISKTVELVADLREERDIIMKDLEAALAAKEESTHQLAELREENARISRELDSVRAEVKARVQKVLGQLDLLGAS